MKAVDSNWAGTGKTTIMSTLENENSVHFTQALLKYTFVVLPIAAGIDKYINFLTNWEQYLNPTLAQMIPFSDHVFMRIVGAIEIIAGIIVWRRAATGGYIVAVWLAAIALTLLAGWMYVDLAVRDIVMAIAAFSMARLSTSIKQQADKL